MTTETKTKGGRKSKIEEEIDRRVQQHKLDLDELISRWNEVKAAITAKKSVIAELEELK